MKKGDWIIDSDEKVLPPPPPRLPPPARPRVAGPRHRRHRLCDVVSFVSYYAQRITSACVLNGARGIFKALGQAKAALARGDKVYLYCIDDAVPGLSDPRLAKLKGDGLNLFGCAYSMRQRKLPLDDSAVFTGLSVLSDIMADTDQFESFN